MIDNRIHRIAWERGVEPAVGERRVTAILALGGIGVTLGIGLCALVAGVRGPNLIAWLGRRRKANGESGQL